MRPPASMEKCPKVFDSEEKSPHNLWQFSSSLSFKAVLLVLFA